MVWGLMSRVGMSPGPRPMFPSSPSWFIPAQLLSRVVVPRTLRLMRNCRFERVCSYQCCFI